MARLQTENKSLRDKVLLLEINVQKGRKESNEDEIEMERKVREIKV